MGKFAVFGDSILDKYSFYDSNRNSPEAHVPIIVNETSKHYLVYNPGRPGSSLKIKNVSDCLPKLTIERAVKRMLSQTETKRLMRRLKIYSDQNHFHQAQNPIEIDVNNLYSSIQLEN